MTAETGAEMTEVAFNVAGAPTYEFNVPSMMCPEGCAPKVREALAEQPGVKEVRVVYETKTATVAVDLDQFDPQAAIAELEDEYGFADTTLKSAPAVTPEVSLPAEGNVDG